MFGRRLIVFQRRLPDAGSIVFVANIVAGSVDKCAKLLRLTKAALRAQRLEHPAEGLLADVFDVLRGTDARSQLDPDQLPKIGRKMLLCPEVSRTQPLYIRFIKR